MFHGFEFAVMGKIDRSERSTRRSTYRKSWESRFDDAEFLRNSRGRKSRNSRGHPSLGPRLCNDYLVFTSLLDPADRIWRMDNLIPNDESTSLDCVDQKLDRIYPFSSFVFCFEKKNGWSVARIFCTQSFENENITLELCCGEYFVNGRFPLI